MSDSNFDSILSAGRAIGGVRTEHNGIPFAVIPTGYKAESIEPFLTLPARKRNGRRALIFTEVESFNRYVTAHKTPGTHIFSDVSGASAVLDWHQSKDAGWGDHIASLVFKDTPEWRKLAAIHKKVQTQHEFCEFLEDNLGLIVVPSSAELLEIIESLEGKKAVQFNQAVKLTNGTVKLGFSEEVELRGGVNRTDGAVELPQRITAAAARYEGGEVYKIDCRLRYRLNDRKLTFTVIIDNLDAILKDAFDGILAQIENGTTFKPLI